MPHITWKKSLFRILSRHLSRLLISLSPASTNILQQQEAISVLRFLSPVSEADGSAVTMTTITSMSPIDHMCNISHTDCLVLFSFPRYSSQDEVTAEMAHDAGASIIVITDKPSSLLAKYADILLTVPVDSNTFFNSMIGPQFVTEALLEIISHRAKGIEKRLNIIDKYLNKLGNY